MNQITSSIQMRRGMGVNGATPPVVDIAVDYATNPVLMYALWANGKAANPEYMTKEEAAAVTSITFTFQNNTRLTSLEELQWFTSLTSLPNNFCNGASNLRSVILPPSLTSLPNYAFSSAGSNITAANATELDLSHITSLGTNAVWSCKFCKKVILNDNLTSIGVNCFYNTTNLKEINFPTTITSIGGSAFLQSSINVDVYLPNIVSISDQAFRGTQIKSFVCGDSLARIETYEFNGCGKLKTLDFGTGITYIGSQSFRFSSNITSMTFRSTTPPTLASTEAFLLTGSGPIYVPAESVTAYKTATNWSSVASRIQAIQ